MCRVEFAAERVTSVFDERGCALFPGKSFVYSKKLSKFLKIVMFRLLLLVSGNIVEALILTTSSHTPCGVVVIY